LPVQGATDGANYCGIMTFKGLSHPAVDIRTTLFRRFNVVTMSKRRRFNVLCRLRRINSLEAVCQRVYLREYGPDAPDRTLSIQRISILNGFKRKNSFYNKFRNRCG